MEEDHSQSEIKTLDGFLDDMSIGNDHYGDVQHVSKHCRITVPFSVLIEGYWAEDLRGMGTQTCQQIDQYNAET